MLISQSNIRDHWTMEAFFLSLTQSWGQAAPFPEHLSTAHVDGVICCLQPSPMPKEQTCLWLGWF